MKLNRLVVALVSCAMGLGTLTACDGPENEDDLQRGLQAQLGPFMLLDAEPAGEVDTQSASVTQALAVAPSPVAGPAKNLKPKKTLVIDWLRWALIQPYADGAIADTTGEDCGMGQQGPVFFLAGTFGGPVTRECDIPTGKQLFFPLVNRWGVFPPEFYEDEQDMLDNGVPYVEAWFDGRYADTCGLTLRLDGVELNPDFDALYDDLYIKIMDPFEVELHPEHWAPEYFAGGVMPAAGDGHYARLQPLTPGDHVLELGGTVCGEYPFETSATYLLHVGG